MRPVNVINKISILDKKALRRCLINHLAPLVKSDRKFIELKWKQEFGHALNLSNPQTFNEKLQWLKLFDRKPIYTKMVDKYEAREYILSKVGEAYIVPLLGVWDRPDQIQLKDLPQKFVLKCTHDSGGVIVCKDKSMMDEEDILSRLNRYYSKNYYVTNREWPYKNVTKRVIAEEYLGDNLQDFRLYCFNGEVKLIYSYTNKSAADGSKPEPSYCDIFDKDWTPLPFHQHYLPSGYVEKPKELGTMIELAEKLSGGTHFLRVDFFDIGGKIYVGELTFFPGAGLASFYPDCWDKTLGDLLLLPKDKLMVNEK